MDKLTKDERSDGVRRVQEYFRDERGEEVGDLGAGILLDFIEKELGPAFYNRGVRDAKALAMRFSDSLHEELESLERLTPKATRAKR